MSEEPHPLVNALRKKVTHQADTIESLEDRVAELEELVDPDPGGTHYQQLTKEQKVHRVRKHLVTLAGKSDGRARMTYKEVMALFDGHPSAGHCYDLMERAGELAGFAYDEAGDGTGQKRVRVNIDDVNDETLLHAVNNRPTESPA